MKKKIIAISMTVALLAIAIVGASLAYFTDTDNAENTFTVGKVEIELIEQQRGEDGLEDFEDDKVLIPIVGSAQGEKDEWGMPVAANYVDKIITVKNLESDAYVRVYVAVPAALLSDDVANNPLHSNLGNRFDPRGQGLYNTPGGQSTWNPDFLNWDYDDPEFDVTIDGVDYKVGTYTYKEVLSEDDVTGAACIVGFYLDKRVDYDADTGNYTMAGEVLDFDFTDGIKIPVFAVGVQADGFEDADAAFTAALPANYNPWE